jgi:tetratricopeptide (TPR) repeat protein
MDVQLREGSVEIPTNRLHSTSVNPALFGAVFHPFPYSMQNHTDETATPITWRTVEIENEYLKLVVLPDMGGHIAQLYDKLAGRDIITPIRAIKPRMIAHRGAWAAGGMEFNFPISHSPTTLDTVNCLTRRYPDGSASVVFGAIERFTFMNWKVELRLYPDLAYLEQSVELLNPTDNFHRYYWWTNAAVPYVRGMRMVYPFDWRTTLDRGYEKWPIDGLWDCSDPATISDSYETFGKLMTKDYFGVYYPDWDFGVAHAASRKRVKGAKFFTWGNGELAHAWNGALLPNGEEYIEIQSGLLESQGVFKHLKPHGNLCWKEYWYAVRSIGMYCQASRDVALAMERGQNDVVLRFSSNGHFENTLVRVTHDGQLQQYTLSLTPEYPTAVEFTGIGAEEILTVDVFCGGRLLLSLGHEAEAMDEAPDTDLFEDSRTFHEACEYDDKPLARGMSHEQWGRLAAAIEAYEEYLCENPNCTVTLNRLGRIMLAQHRPSDAMDYFERSLRVSNRDGTARFGLAAAVNLLGDAEQARRLYYDISADDPMFEASILEAAALNIRLENPYDNLTLLECCEQAYGRFLMEVSRRLANLQQAQSEDVGGLNELFIAEQFLRDGKSTALLKFTAGQEDQLVCIALEYARLGLMENCLSILTLIREATMKTALAKAVCGFIPLQQALTLPVGGVFVNEPLLLDLLESCDDSTGKAQWLLGCFKYSVGLKDESLDCWLEAYEQGLRHTALLYSLGQAYYKDGDLDEARKYLHEDAALHQSANAESLVLLFCVLKECGDVFGRLEMLPLLQEADNKPMVAEQIVEALLDGGLLEEALAVLETAPFQNWEGAETSGLLWSRVTGELALKLAQEGKAAAARNMAERVFSYPDNLNFGRRPTQSMAEFWRLLGQTYRLTGDKARARGAFLQGAQEGAVPAIHTNDEAMRWVRLCQDELRAF